MKKGCGNDDMYTNQLKKLFDNKNHDSYSPFYHHQNLFNKKQKAKKSKKKQKKKVIHHYHHAKKKPKKKHLSVAHEGEDHDHQDEDD